MKKYISVVLIMLLIPFLFGCKETEAPQKENKEEYSQKYDGITIDIFDNNGYYAFMADPELIYYDENLTGIYIEDTTLLAFQIPEKYTQGVGIVDGKEVLGLSDKIKNHLAGHSVDQKTKQLLSEILQKIDDIQIITGAST